MRTRGAALSAFRDLVLAQPLAQVSLQAVAERAKVGRSTLYEHFAGKSALVAASIAGPFGHLAGTLDESPRPADLERVLKHFWENRALARTMFLGPLRRRVEAVLVKLVKQKLEARGCARRGALLMPPALAAASLAQMLLAPVLLWLEGESRLEAKDLAQALTAAAQSTLAALRVAP